MKPFCFMRNTPEYIRRSKSGGQYNGYIAFSLDDKHLVSEWDEFFGHDVYKWNNTEEATFCEVTTLRNMGAIFPVMEIPGDALAGQLFIVGFDTCHSWDTYEDNDYDGVFKRLWAWYTEATEYLEQERDDYNFQERLNEVARLAVRAGHELLDDDDEVRLAYGEY